MNGSRERPEDSQGRPEESEGRPEESEGSDSEGTAPEGTGSQGGAPDGPVAEPGAIPAEGTPAPRDHDRIFANPRPSPSGGRSSARGAAAGSGPTGSGSGGPGTTWPGQGSRASTGAYGPADPQHGGPVGPEERHRIRTRGRVALVFGIGSIVFSILFFPLGLVLGIVAIVLALLARRAGGRVALHVPGTSLSLVLGILAAVFSSVVLIIAGIFWNEIERYQECVSGANTNAAQTRCLNDFQDTVTDRIAG